MAMVLVDTSVWVSHFRKSNIAFESLLLNDRVLCHPLVMMEIACGSPPSPRSAILGYLKKLQQATIATTDETLEFIETHKLYESGCGAIDMSLLASALLSEKAQIWTLDRNLESLALKFNISFSPILH